MERNVSDPYREILLKVADLFNSMTSLEDAKKLVNNPRSLAAIEWLERLDEVLKLYGVDAYVSYDLGMLSKYNYYTGVIFKAYTYGVGNAIITGGRYNTLLGRFGKKAPAIGFAIVIDDCLEALARQKSSVPTKEDPIILTYDREEEGNFAKALKEAQKLRGEGKRVVLLSEESTTGKAGSRHE